MKKSFLSIITLSILLSSCSNDLDIAADWKEVPVVYGVLNIKETDHYVQIFKGFLDEERGPDEILLLPDSIYYPDNILTVTIRVNNTDIPLQRVILPPRDSGIFVSDPNYAYTFSENLLPNRTYVLTITNNRSGKVFTAQTPIVNDFSINNPDEDEVEELDLAIIGSNDRVVRWTKAVNGSIYDLTIRFHYEEWRSDDPSNKTTQYIDWTILTNYNPDKNQEGTNYEIKSDFFSFVGASIAEDPNLVRRALVTPLEYRFYVGAEELANYIDANRSQNGITAFQANTPYSNVYDTSGNLAGLGIFSSRYNEAVFAKLNNRSLDSLSFGQKTGHLNFIR